MIYLDNQSTTQIDPRVLDTMMPFLTSEFGNSASRTHELGRRAATAVTRARQQVAGLLDALEDEIVFTSGATEAINLALKGLWRQMRPGATMLLLVRSSTKPYWIPAAISQGSARHSCV